LVNLAATPVSAQNIGVPLRVLCKAARRNAPALILVCFAAYAQALLDDATIGKLAKAGVGEQAILAVIEQQPGNYALGSNDVMALKKAGVSERIISAMVARNQAANGSARTPTTPLALHDATPIRLRLTRDLTFNNVKPGEMVDFEILDDLRIDGLLVMAHGARATATITMAEPKTRMGRGGKLGVSLETVPLVNGAKVPIRAAKEIRRDEPAATGGDAQAALIKPAAPHLLFTYGRDELFQEGTGTVVYIDGEIRLDPTRFLVDMQFTSNPPGALVYLYGAPIGRTPFTTRLAPGSYKAVFSAEGYYDLNKTIPVGPGYENVAHAAFELKP